MNKGNMSVLSIVDSSKREDYGNLQEILWSALDFYGMPYTILDLAKDQLSPEMLHDHSVIIIGQEHLGKSLSERDNRSIVDAIEAGVGFVCFDGDLHSYKGLREALGLKTTEEGTHMPHLNTSMVRIWDNKHFITNARDLEFVRFNKPVEVGNIINIEKKHRLLMIIANSSGCPAMITETLGKGRVVIFAVSPKIWLNEFFGHDGGLDDIFWKSIVWAARKPFVMLAMPPFVTMRIDDCSGANDFEWVRILNRHGFMPHVSLFTDNISQQGARTVKQLYDDGLAEFSVHAFTWTRQTFWEPKSPSDHSEGSEFSREDLESFFKGLDELADKWGIEWSKVLTAHFGEVGRNVIPFLKARGITYLGMPYSFGVPYGKAILQLPKTRLKGLKPFDGQGGVIDHHPDYSDLFIVYPSYWAVPGSVREKLVAKGVIAPGGQVYDFLWETAREKVDVELAAWYAAFGIKLCLDSLSCAVLVTHEQNISVLNNDEWDMLLSRVDQLTSKYGKIYKSWSYIAEYAENLYNSKLSSASLDPETGKVECHLEGKSNLPLYLHVYQGDPELLGRSFKEAQPYQDSATIEFKPTDLYT